MESTSIETTNLEISDSSHLANDQGSDKLEQPIDFSPLADLPNTTSQFMFYAAKDGAIKVQVMLGDETVWASQKGMSEIFDVEPNTISYHLKNIYEINELDESTTTRKIRLVVDSGPNHIQFYNLDAIISVGYRVNSSKATQFRRWATSILKEYMIKGYALDDERLKQGNQLFGQDYFDELLERIRKIRTSERMFWQNLPAIAVIQRGVSNGDDFTAHGASSHRRSQYRAHSHLRRYSAPGTVRRRR